MKDSSVANAKMEQLVDALAKHVHIEERPSQESPTKPNKGINDPEVFISYCWTNSMTAFEAKEIKQCIGEL